MTLFRVQAYNNFSDPDSQYYQTQQRRAGSGVGKKRPVLPKLNTSAREDGESGTYIHRELNLPNDTGMGSLLSTARTETQRSERGKVDPKLVPTIWGSAVRFPDRPWPSHPHSHPALGLKPPPPANPCVARAERRSATLLLPSPSSRMPSPVAHRCQAERDLRPDLQPT